jgi:outer membrane receptor protein involved in Fe transport
MISRNAAAWLCTVSALAFSSVAAAQTAPATPQSSQIPSQATPNAPPGSAATTETAAPAEMSSQPLANRAPTTAQNAVSEVVVTGSRITANGFKAPTPVTAVSTVELAKLAPESIPAGLDRLPQFSATTGTNANNNQGGIPNAGNYLNLRGLGTLENLVLVNGQRLPATSYNGAVDTNLIPQGLITQVDVVTGGASAAYGSDAVSGVVNFILDTKFDGVKGQLSGGVSDFGDDADLRADIVAGTKFAGGRGHIEVSYDHFDQPGLYNSQRPYGNSLITEVGAGTVANPYHPASNVHIANGAFGTLIEGGATAASCPTGPTSCKFSTWALTNTTFTPSGAAVPFNPGTTTGFSNYNIGGDGGYTFGSTLTASQDTDQFFLRTDYDLTDHLHAFAQMSFVSSDNSYTTVADGTQLSSFQIDADNAYLPTSVSSAMVANGITSFEGSRIEADQTPKFVNTYNASYVLLAGLNGDVDGLNWNATYSHGDSLLRSKQEGNFNQANWLAALDAVRGPNGNIVCDVTLTNPGLYPGCTPYDPFGVGAPSSSAEKYIEATSQYQVHNVVDDVAAQLNGQVFHLPAGPIDFAIGAEAREESLKEESNTNPADPINLTGLNAAVTPFYLEFNSTNVGPSTGSENVEEGFAEIAVPILRDLPFAERLDFNAAARYTHYSVSGGATTYKFGASYTPIHELRFRGTYSQDIRAPTLYELFAGPSATRGIVNDPLTNLSENALTFTEGNPTLKPEIAHTYTIGAIWQPAYIPGFSASVDYFHIEIDDKIVQLSSTQILGDCILSVTAPECAYIDRPLGNQTNTSAANFPISIDSVSFNEAFSETDGIDYELNYHLPLNRFISAWTARMDFRLIGTYTPDFKVSNGPGQPIYQEAGVVGAITGSPGTDSSPVPVHKFNIQSAYSDGPLQVNLQMRYIGEMVQTTVPTIHYTNEHVAAIAYFDGAVSYDWTVDGHRFTSFLNVTNMFNKAPPLVPYGQPGEFYPTNQELYDVVGRYYTAGVRFRF